jgi:hypothetical protein
MRTILLGLLMAVLLVACSQVNAPTTDISTEWTDATSCTSNTDCSDIEFGCGGGHTMCTSDPESYKDRMSTCEIVEDHPSEQGYSCQCVEQSCVWKK